MTTSRWRNYTHTPPTDATPHNFLVGTFPDIRVLFIFIYGLTVEQNTYTNIKIKEYIKANMPTNYKTSRQMPSLANSGNITSSLQ